MKFIHIADVHLGAIPDANQPWGTKRGKEIWNSLYHIIEVCNEEKAELLLIAGDLFHRQPLLRELKELNYYFTKLTMTRVVIIAGNHDYIGTRSFYSGFEWDKKVHMFLKDTLEILDLPELNTQIYGLSYLQQDITEPLYDTIKIEKNNRIHILLAHGGDERNIPINRKSLEGAGFDYVALGHIHKPELISSRMAYAGSLEPMDKTETGERGYILGQIHKTGEATTRIVFVPASIRQYRRLTVEVNQEMTNGKLLDHIREIITTQGTQHIYQFIIQGFRDEQIHFDREAIKSLGNILEVTDRSVPDYNFDALCHENEDNMIGMFIRQIREKANQDEVVEKALYYGIEALLGAKDT